MYKNLFEYLLSVLLVRDPGVEFPGHGAVLFDVLSDCQTFSQ